MSETGACAFQFCVAGMFYVEMFVLIYFFFLYLDVMCLTDNVLCATNQLAIPVQSNLSNHLPIAVGSGQFRFHTVYHYVYLYYR